MRRVCDDARFLVEKFQNEGWGQKIQNLAKHKIWMASNWVSKPHKILKNPLTSNNPPQLQSIIYDSLIYPQPTRIIEKSIRNVTTFAVKKIVFSFSAIHLFSYLFFLLFYFMDDCNS